MQAEKILRAEGDKPHHPRVLLLAQTGKAASIIGKCLFRNIVNVFYSLNIIFLGGTTIHGAFDFKFGIEVTTSGDKKLAQLRENLSEVKLIIIDEMSLVSADQLYKIDAKLREIFHLNKQPFGGIAIVLVGDLLQIPPVKGVYIFKRPNFEKSGVAYDLVEYEGKLTLYKKLLS